MAVENWNELIDAAEQGFADGVACHGSIAASRRANRQNLIEIVDDAKAGRAARLLLDGALFRSHIYLVRAFDPPSAKAGDDINLRAAIDFLRQPGAVEFAHEDRHADLHFAIERFDAAAADPALQTLRLMRNKMLAHWAKYDETKPRPTYSELFGFAERVGKVSEALAHGTAIHFLSMESQGVAYIESAETFWSIWDHGED